jgi:hypothetical protein
MKISILILILPLFLTLNSKAQLSFIDSSKNEIGIAINPFMNAFGITANDDFMTLQFKHHFDNVSLRIGVTGIGSNTYDNANYRSFNYKLTDSTTRIDHFYEEKTTTRISLGLEQQQMLKNNWKFFYGMDLLGGIYDADSRIERSIYKRQPDSTYKPYNGTDTIMYSKQYYLVGIAFVGGFDYFFSKRISAGILGYFPIIYEFQTGNLQNRKSSVSYDQKLSILITMHF